MSRHYESTAALCPFYKWEDERKRKGKPPLKLIVCEGYEKGQFLTLSMNSAKKAERWKEEKCRSCWRTCPHAQELLKRE